MGVVAPLDVPYKWAEVLGLHFPGFLGFVAIRCTTVSPNEDFTLYPQIKTLPCVYIIIIYIYIYYIILYIFFTKRAGGCFEGID